MGRTAHEAMKTRKPKIGGRYVAWMRGAFESVTVAPVKKAKPEAKAGAVDATRANGGGPVAARTGSGGSSFERLRGAQRGPTWCARETEAEIGKIAAPMLNFGRFCRSCVGVEVL